MSTVKRQRTGTYVSGIVVDNILIDYTPLECKKCGGVTGCCILPCKNCEEPPPHIFCACDMVCFNCNKSIHDCECREDSCIGYPPDSIHKRASSPAP